MVGETVSESSTDFVTGCAAARCRPSEKFVLPIRALDQRADDGDGIWLGPLRVQVEREPCIGDKYLRPPTRFPTSGRLSLELVYSAGVAAGWVPGFGAWPALSSCSNAVLVTQRRCGRGRLVFGHATCGHGLRS